MRSFLSGLELESSILEPKSSIFAVFWGVRAPPIILLVLKSEVRDNEQKGREIERTEPYMNNHEMRFQEK